jgi:glycosyltransferase involved in cell wall biosynthesis
VKILFVYYYPSGGVETLARQRSSALRNMGIQFHFLYFYKGPGLQNIDEPVFITNDDQEIQNIIKREEYDAMIVCSDYTFLPRARRLEYKGPLIYEVQGLGPINAAKKYLKSGQQIVQNYATCLLYPRTPHLMRLMDEYFPLKAKHCFHNCIDTETFRYQDGLPVESFQLIGWVGRLEDNKNWKDFLEIAASIIKRNFKLKIWIFTDDTLDKPEQVKAFQLKAQQLRLKQFITIYKNVPNKEMPIYYTRIGNSGGFLCSTSKTEGFGYAIVEAMSCLCPVVTTDSDGIKSFIFHNETGKIFPHGNISKATAEGVDLLLNTTLKNSIRHNARNYVTENLSPQIYANNFKNLLKSLQLNI